MDEITECHPILLDIDKSNNFSLEVGYQNNEIIIVMQFDSYAEPIMMSLDSYRKIARMQLNIEAIVKNIQNNQLQEDTMKNT